MRTRKRVTNNLVVMGSAAVVAVYAAGFVRTADAAEKFAEMSDERRPVIAPSRHDGDASTPAVAMTSRAERAASGAASSEKAPSTAQEEQASRKTTDSTASQANAVSAAKGAAPTVSPAIAAPAVASKPSTPSAVAASTLSTTPAAAAAAAAAASIPTTTSASAASKSTVAPGAAAVAAPSTAPSVPLAITNATTSSVSPPSAPIATPPAPSASPTETPAVTPAPVATDVSAKGVAVSAASKPPLPPGVKYRDGEYYGWGTSRHGDIQAYVEVTNGKVSYVKIAQCLTQYSCDVIDVLPGQVFTRNGPEVDAVSGATQSSNAFYYAVQQALSKAK